MVITWRVIMATLKNIFDKCGVALYQNESLDLDHYYQDRTKMRR